MSNEKIPLWFKILFCTITVIVFYFLTKNQIRRKEKLEDSHRYVIGKTDGWIKNHRSSAFDIHYVYKVKGVRYRESMKIESLSGIKTKDGQYIVMFNPENPRNNWMLFEYFVPPSRVIYTSDTGWIQIPEGILNANGSVPD